MATKKKANYKPRKTRCLSTSFDGVTTNVYAKNMQVVLHVLYGFSTQAICKATGMTPAQVNVRVRSYGLQGVRRSFRNGESKEAKQARRELINGVSENKQRRTAVQCEITREEVLAANRKAREKAKKRK